MTTLDPNWTTIVLDSHPAGASCRVALDRGWYGADDGEDVFIKSARKVSGRVLYARRSNTNGHVVIVAAANIKRGSVRTFKNCAPGCVVVST